MRRSRRNFLGAVGTAAIGTVATDLHWSGTTNAAPPNETKSRRQPFFRTRGVVLVPSDLTWKGWPVRAKEGGLTTISLHHGAALDSITDLMRSDAVQTFLGQCRNFEITVEHELHAIHDLLPRSLFVRNPEFFRINEAGERAADSNLCIHSDRALEIVAENAVAVAKVLRSSTNRYFFWGDDAKPWCRCSRCRALSDADQALALENYLIAALRKFDQNAQLAHLAYSSTIAPPRQIKPVDGIFLEFAPIKRRYDIPYARQTGNGNADNLDLLDANLAVFGAKGAQVLEYWLDVSRFSKWKRPAVKLPWNPDLFSADLDTYGARGIHHVTTFAVFIDADYIAAYGEPPLRDYGRRLLEWQPGA